MILSKEQILAKKKPRVVEVPTPEWGDDDAKVCVRALKGWQRDDFDSYYGDALERNDLKHTRAKLVAMSLCDADGKFLEFTEEDILARKLVGPKSKLQILISRPLGPRPAKGER